MARISDPLETYRKKAALQDNARACRQASARIFKSTDLCDPEIRREPSALRFPNRSRGSVEIIAPTVSYGRRSSQLEGR